MTEKLKNMIDELAKFDLDNCDDPRWAEHRIKELKREADRENNPYRTINMYNLIEKIYKENKEVSDSLRELSKSAFADILYDYTLIIINLIKDEASDVKENTLKQNDTILERLDLIKDAINTLNKDYCSKLDTYSDAGNELERKTCRLITSNSELANSNTRLTNIIESIINDKFTSKEFEAVMIKPYREKPILIKDGKRIDNENMTSFDIDWGWDRRIEMNVRSE
jgi:hypothetical protein